MAEGGAIIVLVIIAGLALVLAATFAILWHRRRPGALQAESARFKSAAMIAERSRQAADARAAFLSEILDALPSPVWRRADDLELIYANKAYAEAVGADTPAAALLDNMEIGGVEALDLARRAHRTNATLSESRKIVVSGKRQLVETTERPLGGEEPGRRPDRRRPGRHSAGRSARWPSPPRCPPMPKCWRGVGSAVAVFTGGRQLAFCNKAFVDPVWPRPCAD